MGQEALVAVLANPKNILDPDGPQPQPEYCTTVARKGIPRHITFIFIM
jgi:hypothetical protein